MEPGLSSFAFGWAVAHGALDEQALLASARRHGVRVVQLGDNLPVHALTPERRGALRAAAEAAGIRLELGARGLTAALLRAYVELCGELGADFLRFVADQGGHEPSLDAMTAILREAAPALAAAGVTLGLENHDRFGARELRGVIEAVASPHVGICLDTANSLGAGEGLAEVAAVLAPLTVNLHVKDVAITRLPHQQGFTVEGRPLGGGRLPLRAALARVRAAGRCRSAIVELWVPPEPDLAATRAKEAAWAEQSLAALRTLLAEGAGG
jgi:sugar phosphate isomerase/epimerase